MRLSKSIVLGLGLAFAITSCDTNSKGGDNTTIVLENQADSFGYAYGVLIGGDLFKRAVQVNPDAMANAMKIAAAGEDGIMSTEDAQKFMEEFGKRQQKQEEIKALDEAKLNKVAGAKFLADNAKRPDIQVSDSGVQYEVLKSGQGATPAKTDGVVVHYTGTLMDGTVFDSSVEKGQPATFGVTQVIPGWTEALLKMKEGDKWKVYIPADMAYGDRGNQGIPPGSTLIFEMELLEVLTK